MGVLGDAASLSGMITMSLNTNPANLLLPAGLALNVDVSLDASDVLITSSIGLGWLQLLNAASGSTTFRASTIMPMPFGLSSTTTVQATASLGMCFTVY